MNQRRAGICGKASITSQVYNRYMKLTKYDHACFTVEKDSYILVVDPGDLTDNLVVTPNIDAVVITHKHADHFEPELLELIYKSNPNAKIFAPAEVIELLSLPNLVTTKHNDSMRIGPFDLKFYGTNHQKPFDDSPTIENTGVLINDIIYHPGDSFFVPENMNIDILMLPVSGSWMKASMARDFLNAVHPKVAIPTHDAILSQKGQAQVDKYWPVHAKKINCTYQRLNAPLEI